MSEATDADREKAHLVLGYGPSTTRTYLTIEYARVEGVAAALAEEREKARAPFLAGVQQIREIASEAARTMGGEEFAVRVAMITKELPR